MYVSAVEQNSQQLQGKQCCTGLLHGQGSCHTPLGFSNFA
jgi:hypothetical protein